MTSDLPNDKIVAIVGIVGVPARYGGFETLVENLLDDSRHFLVYCSRSAYVDRPPEYKGAELVYLPIAANGVQSIVYDVVSIWHALLTGKRQILMLGVSGAITLPLAKFIFPSARFSINIDGLEWKRIKWGRVARFVLKYFEKVAVMNATTIVCDNQAIVEYVWNEYRRRSELIAYGGDHAVVDCIRPSFGDYALSVCRIEPENNIHLILEAFSSCGAKIKIIGNWDSSSYGRNLYEKYSSHPDIDLMGPVYDVHVLFSIRQGCKFYVHGHSAGGTNPSLVEMMHFGRPILAFDCPYNRATMEDHGKYFFDVNSLKSALTHTDWLDADACVFPSIAKRRYSWHIVRQQYMDLFDFSAS